MVINEMIAIFSHICAHTQESTINLLSSLVYFANYR